MIQRISSFFAIVRQKLFEWRLESEIYGQVFPHLEKEGDHGYDFASDEELRRLIRHGNLDAQFHLEMITNEGKAMPKAYGEAFRYIAFRDINRRLAMYRAIATRRVQPKSCDPRRVATHA
jgi:hypothetical protein